MIRRRPAILPLVALLAAALAGCDPSPGTPDAAYVAEIEAWRANRDQRLRSADGWLTLVGLHWLEPGEQRFGSGDGNDVRLPPGRVADHVGTLVLADGKVTVRAPAEVGLTLDGEVVTEHVLASDAAGTPDILVLDELRMHVIRRGDRFGLRVKDPRSEVLAAFQGMEYFPIDERYRVEGRWMPYDPPREVSISEITGGVSTMLCPGRVEFELLGEELALEPLMYAPDDERLFYIFKDGTSGHETYAAGRFLYGPLPQDGVAVIDFNKAYSPPCVFTPYATCPLPPRQNWLEPRIEAGEKTHH